MVLNDAIAMQTSRKSDSMNAISTLANKAVSRST